MICQFNNLYINKTTAQENKPSIKNVAQLVALLDNPFDFTSKKFNDRPLSLTQTEEILDRYNKTFTAAHNPGSDFGFIEKKDVSQNSTISVRADLHGDLKSLIETLKALQKKKVLDENFRCVPNCYLVFLGDYVDRGYYNLEVVSLLALLKLENPEQTWLIQGNHDNALCTQKRLDSQGKLDPHFTEFLQNPSSRKKLEHFFQTLPLTLYLGEKNGEAKRQYVGFTHTLFELTADPSAILDSAQDSAKCSISKKREISERVKQLASATLVSKKTVSARRIMELAALDTDQNRETLQRSTYNWADPGDKTCIGSLVERNWTLSAEDIKHYLRIASNSNKVKMFFRGHDHEEQQIMEAGKKDMILVATLPVGLLSPAANKKGPKKDTTYILTTHHSARQWKKERLMRASGEKSVAKISCSQTLRATFTALSESASDTIHFAPAS